jgi:hypothetical protein
MRWWRGGRTELICLVGPVQELFRHLFDIQHWHRPAGGAARTQRPSAPEISRTSSSPAAAGGATFQEGARRQSLSLSSLDYVYIFNSFLFRLLFTRMRLRELFLFFFDSSRYANQLFVMYTSQIVKWALALARVIHHPPTLCDSVQ